jgi:hypothetical protein
MQHDIDVIFARALYTECCAAGVMKECLYEGLVCRRIIEVRVVAAENIPKGHVIISFDALMSLI